MTLENYVKLVPGVEKVLRFKPESFRIEPRQIRDPVTKAFKGVRAGVADVTEEDGKPVTKTYSTLSEKHAAQLGVLHDNGQLYHYKIGLTVRGSGYGREYQIRLI